MQVITLEVVPTDEIFVAAWLKQRRAMSHETWQLSCHLASIWIKSEAVSSSTKYDFWLASVQLTNTKIGEADRVIFGAK
jgi:hypothetical protein